jgi:two-component system probable response regulator PhcQ
MSSQTDYKKYAVLYVDDEEQALKYFRKMLDKEFQILTAPGVPQAMEIMNAQAANVGVVITDQRMPGQLGVELLTQVRQKWPNIMRVLITAFSDIESAIAAVNAGSIFKYLTKPADFQTLRETLKAALDQFFGQAQKETLLQEKVSTLQRMVVADRVRSLAALAGGISHHLRNSMTAMTCFLEETSPAGDAAAAASADPYARDLWALAQKEREQLLGIVQKVGQTVVEPSVQFADQLDLLEMVQQGAKAALAPELDAARIAVNIPAGTARVSVDASMMTRLCKTLLAYAARLGAKDGKVTVTANANVPMWNTTGVQIFFRGEGPAWSDRDVSSLFTPFAFPAADPSDLGLDPLIAFFIAYHHGGDVLVHPAPPEGPGFELRLALDPKQVRRPELQDGLLQKLFSPFSNTNAIAPAA